MSKGKTSRRRERDLDGIARAIVESLRAVGIDADSEPSAPPDSCNVTRFKDLVASDTWTEIWPDGNGDEQSVAVTAEIWTAAIQAALDANRVVYIPYRRDPYYIDAPLILRSGHRLIADPRARIRLKPFSNTCMVRNQNIVSGQDGPVDHCADPDRDIIVQGGIWTTLATADSQSNGNERGRADGTDSCPGAHGTILFHNVRGIQLKDMTIRGCRPFGVQIGNCREFLVENIFFDCTRRDGVHVEGPASRGVIRDIRGETGDDVVALNAWDWKQYSVTFGPIENVLVERVQGTPGRSVNAIRLLAGTKNFESGQRTHCDVSNCVFRHIHAIEDFKLYDQPNLELGRDYDFAEPIGHMHDLLFDDIRLDALPLRGFYEREALFHLAADVENVVIRNVALNFEPPSSFVLVDVGPISATFKPRQTQDDPATWREIFSPDKDCTVKHLTVSGVRTAAGAKGKGELTPVDAEKLIRVGGQTVNSDYPATTPRGGTGKGFLVN